MFGQEVREDRAGWMDGQAANLGNRQMAAVLIPGTHLSWCALHCCMKNLAFVQKDTYAHVIICMYVHLEILWSSGHLRQWQKDIYVMCASEMTINALAQVCIMWRLKSFIAEVWGFGELPKSNKEASACHKLSCLLTFHVENLAKF